VDKRRVASSSTKVAERAGKAGKQDRLAPDVSYVLRNSDDRGPSVSSVPAEKVPSPR